MRRVRSPALSNEVGQRIRTRRLARRMTQKQLGDTLGLTFQQVQKYEKGADGISIDRLMQIAEALDVAPAVLLPNHTVNGDGRDDLSSLLDSADAIRMARAFKTVCKEWRPFLLHIAQACANKWYPSCDE